MAKWTTTAFRRLRIHGLAQFVDGVFRSEDPLTIARMRAEWVGRYGIVETDEDPPPLPVDPWPQYPLKAQLLDETGKVLDEKLPTRLSDAALRAALVAPDSQGNDRLRAANASPFRTWHAALAARDDVRANVGVVAHSFGEGTGATAANRRWVTQLQTLLRQRFPCVAVADPAGGAGFLPPQYIAPTLPAPAVAAGAAATNVFTVGPGGRGLYLPNGASRTWSLTSATSVDVLFSRITTGANGVVALDGVDQANISLVNATPEDGYTVHYPFGSRGAHTVKVTGGPGGGTVLGIVAYDQDENAGVMVHDASHHGWRASQHSGLSFAGGLRSGFWGLRPSLILVECGINEWTTGVSASTFRTELSALVGYLKATVTPQPSIGLIIDYQNLGTYADTWENYRQAYYAVQAADPTNVAVLDMTRRMPAALSGGGALALNVSDGHPSNKGHGFYAQAVADWIAPR